MLVREDVAMKELERRPAVYSFASEANFGDPYSQERSGERGGRARINGFGLGYSTSWISATEHHVDDIEFGR